MANASASLLARRRGRLSPVGLTQRVLAVAAAATLAVDAYVHLHDAGFYDSVTTSVLSQGTLFRVQAALAVAVGLAVAVRPRPRWWAAALAVLASAAGAALVYTYINVGAVGPLPNMYEPTWVLPGKLISARVETAGAVIAAIGLLISRRPRLCGDRAASAAPERAPRPEDPRLLGVSGTPWARTADMAVSFSQGPSRGERHRHPGLGPRRDSLQRLVTAGAYSILRAELRRVVRAG